MAGWQQLLLAVSIAAVTLLLLQLASGEDP